MPPASVLSASAPSENVSEDSGVASGLALLSRQSLADAQGEAGQVVPPAPETLEDTGLAPSVLQQLILKMFYQRGEMLGRELSEKNGAQVQPDRRDH